MPSLKKVVHLNIEIKAKCTDKALIRTVLHQHKANFKGLDHQVDTYFNCTEGRLKLREGNIENSLIHYNRPNTKSPKASVVSLYHPNPNSTLKGVLINALGIKTIIDKKREIYFIDNVKFHIDEVKGLGSFVEIEAIDYEGNIGEKKLHEQCNYYMQALKIKSNDLIHVSYSDLLPSYTKLN